jgi:hypothetical protein
MDDVMIGRRRLLGRTGLVAGAALAGSVAVATPALAAGTDRGGPAIGAWLVDRTDPAEGPTLQTARGIWMFGAGGVSHYQDLYAVSADGTVKSGASAPLTGAWIGRSERTIDYELWSHLAELAPGFPPLIARTTGTATIDGSTLETTYLVRFYLLDDGPFGDYQGRLTGRRVEL